jgi:stage V sporulation protein B
MRISETGRARQISHRRCVAMHTPPDAESVDIDSPALNGQRSDRPAPEGGQTIDPLPGAPAARAGRSFGSRVAGLTAVRFISVAAGFLTSVVGARLLGTDGVGAAGIAVALATVAAVVANGGINISTIYLLGQRPTQRRQILGALVPIAIGGALLAAAILAVSGATIGPAIGLDERGDLFAAAAGLAAVIVAFEFIGAVVLGLGQTRTYVAAELLRGVGTLAATAVLLVGIWRTDVGFVVAATIAIAVAASLNAYRIVRSIGWVAPRIDSAVAGEALGIGLRGQIGNILQLMNLRLDQLIVPAFLSLSSAGVYLIAVRVSEALAQIGSAAGSLIFPEVARQTTGFETSLTERAVRATSVLIAGAGLAIGLLAEPFLAIAFGQEFADGSLALRILLVAMLPLSVARILAGDLKGRGRPGTVSLAMGLAAAVTVGLDLLLIPRLGIAGAAAASVVAYSISAAILAVSFVRLTGADARALVPGPSDAAAVVRFLRTIRASPAR